MFDIQSSLVYNFFIVLNITVVVYVVQWLPTLFLVFAMRCICPRELR